MPMVRVFSGSPPVRRLLAFVLDYFVIAAYLIILAAASLLILATPLRPSFESIWGNAWSAELAGFFLLTSPVILYFALFESSARGATLGKRALHLRVVQLDGSRLGLGRSLLRSAVKFLPWEMAHFTIWHYVYGSARHANPPSWTTVTLTAVYLLALAYIVTLVIGRTHRTIYDRIAGSRVIVVEQTADLSTSRHDA